MKYKLYQVDAFTDTLFGGNPAAVCPLDKWLDDALLQKIAMENNLSETAFFVPQGALYEIRWFTPTVEVALCGHATLATAFVLFCHEGHAGSSIHFSTRRSGDLRVTKEGDWLTLNFPSDTLQQVTPTEAFRRCFDKKVIAAYQGKSDYLFLFENESDIAEMQPNFEAIANLPVRGLIATAKGTAVDFVSRFFAPQVGVPEDPVTGSAHTSLIPFWSKELKKTELTAIQLSERKGYLRCKHLNDRVEISGQAKLYFTGELSL
jgi:PhzF family phenazine biosynthesis protein